MKKTSRRNFIDTSSKGLGALMLTPGLTDLYFSAGPSAQIDQVDLGQTGLKVSRLALGTGSYGWKRTSAQKKLGEKDFVALARHAHERGVSFFETADMYGTHELVGKAMNEIGRDQITLLTKVMVYSHQGWYTAEPFQKSFDRFRKELNTDYIDILLLHCMVDGEWPDQYKHYMDGFLEAKEKGQIKKVGLSCHSMEAMQVAAQNHWADVLLARINHDGAKMDGQPHEVMQVLKSVKQSGKGVIGMKLFGCGDLVKDEQREQSLQYVIKSQNVDCMTIGFESISQLNDTIDRIMRIVNTSQVAGMRHQDKRL